MDNYHSHAYSPIKRSTPPTSERRDLGMQAATGGGGFHSDANNMGMTYGSQRSYSPAEGSQLSLKNTQSVAKWQTSQIDNKPAEDGRRYEDRPIYSYVDGGVSQNRSPPEIREEEKPTYRVYDTSVQRYANLGPYAYAKIEESPSQSRDKYGQNELESGLTKYHMTNYDKSLQAIPDKSQSETSYPGSSRQYQEQIRVNVIPESSERRSIEPKKSSLLDRFAKKQEDAYEESTRKDKLLDDIPRLLPMSKLPDSYVEKSNSFNQEAFMESENQYESRKEQYESIKKVHNPEAEYFSFSPEPDRPDKWANGSTPSPSKFIDSRGFFSSQGDFHNDDAHKDDATFNKSSKVQTLENEGELKKEIDTLKQKLDSITSYSQRLESQLAESRNSSIHNQGGESSWQTERKQMSEKFKLVKLQSQQIADQADEYKKVADGYIAQLEAKAGHHEKEMRLKDETIKRLQDQINSSRISQGNYGIQYQTSSQVDYSSFSQAISKIIAPVTEFLKDLDSSLQRNMTGSYSDSLVTHILKQLDQLNKNPCDYYLKQEQVIELSNLKVLFNSLLKVITSKLTVAPVPTNRPSIDTQGIQTDRSRSRDQVSGRTSVTTAQRDPAITKKLVEENQKMAIEYSKLKMQNKSLKDHIDNLIGQKPQQYSTRVYSYQ